MTLNGNVLNQLLYYVGLETGTFAGWVNLATFIMCLIIIATPKPLRAIVFVLEWLMFLIGNLFKIKKLKQPEFPADKWGPWPYLGLFAEMIICIKLIS